MANEVKSFREYLREARASRVVTRQSPYGVVVTMAADGDTYAGQIGTTTITHETIKSHPMVVYVLEHEGRMYQMQNTRESEEYNFVSLSGTKLYCFTIAEGESTFRHSERNLVG